MFSIDGARLGICRKYASVVALRAIKCTGHPQLLHCSGTVNLVT